METKPDFIKYIPYALIVFIFLYFLLTNYELDQKIKNVTAFASNSICNLQVNLENKKVSFCEIIINDYLQRGILRKNDIKNNQ